MDDGVGFRVVSPDSLSIQLPSVWDPVDGMLLGPLDLGGGFGVLSFWVEDGVLRLLLA